MTHIIQFVHNHMGLVGLWGAVIASWLGFEAWVYTRGPRRISCQELVSLINHDRARIWDLRPAAAYQAGHIAGAVHVTSADCKRIQPSDLPADQTWIWICDRGQISWRLACMAPRGIAVLRLGMQGWIADNLPMVTGDTTTPTLAGKGKKKK